MTKAAITTILAATAAVTITLAQISAGSRPQSAGREVPLSATAEGQCAVLASPPAPLFPPNWGVAPAYSAQPHTSQPGPTDAPWQVVAHRALSGTWGPLHDWQRIGYSRILHNGSKRRVAWITHYWTGEPGVGTRTASGRRVEAGRTAAMLDVKWGTCVLVNLPHGYTLRQVFDTGAHSNHRHARRHGAETWVDLYVTRRTSQTYVRPIWIERR